MPVLLWHKIYTMLLGNYLKNRLPAIVLMLFISGSCMAQIGMKPYEGHWEGLLARPQNFSINVSVKKRSVGDYALQLSSGGKVIQKQFRLLANNSFDVKVDSNLNIKGVLEGKDIRLFIRSVQWSYHTILKPGKPGNYNGHWNILFVPDLKPKFYIDVENTDSTKYEAYIFLGDQRFVGFASGGLTLKGNDLHFADYRTGLQFNGKILTDAITLQASIAGLPITSVTLHRSVKDWDLNQWGKLPFDAKIPANMQDGLPISSLKAAGFDESYLKQMVDSINANKITNTHSVLITRNGKLVYEQYFNGYDEATVHDLRSASKSISSAIVGIVMDKGLLKDTAQKLLEFLPAEYKHAADGDARKQAISIGSLLTMSSGLDAIDFGIDRKSVASEDEYQNSADWLKTVVEAPMINYPGTHANYSSANPYLLGVIVDTVVKHPLDLFIDQNLFAPLGISNYIIFDDQLKRPYFGGGMLLRPRDLLKFGLLYADGGKWENRQLISKSWVDASFKKYLILENHNEKNEYGFLWWHYHYQVNGKIINTVEARGAGGQYIFIVPYYQLVVVITSANFRNGRVWQPEKIMENYILKAVGGK
ncbi:serine hydrolase domain-containing protein [Mucilaginibacter sp. FT3.2]|uniref:serine hydrolase domain-containing protein n=1 Tax=Mucilaginibacter sp. FT3.2 TaxID=2723090 RepID=UPI001616B7AA|nr:serine hydrolase [Mucilaginibacter sp. FT3.2]MBB6230030.1 CubicO group peptidase (beta-lactamase class C family) [Mucilaginibacter sp. FT3.2]